MGKQASKHHSELDYNGIDKKKKKMLTQKYVLG